MYKRVASTRPAKVKLKSYRKDLHNSERSVHLQDLLDFEGNDYKEPLYGFKYFGKEDVPNNKCFSNVYMDAKSSCDSKYKLIHFVRRFLHKVSEEAKGTTHLE